MAQDQTCGCGGVLPYSRLPRRVAPAALRGAGGGGPGSNHGCAGHQPPRDRDIECATARIREPR
jgi:hypothetical protein